MSSKTINFKATLLMPNGKESEGETVSDALVNILAASPCNNVEDTMKIGGWWKQISSSGELTLDAADQKKFKDLISTYERATTFIKIQILDLLEADEKESKSKTK